MRGSFRWESFRVGKISPPCKSQSSSLATPPPPSMHPPTRTPPQPPTHPHTGTAESPFHLHHRGVWGLSTVEAALRTRPSQARQGTKAMAVGTFPQRQAESHPSPRPPAPYVTFRLVVVSLRGPGQSPVLSFPCCIGSLLSVSRCGRCSRWCRFRVRGAQWLVCRGCAGCYGGRLTAFAVRTPPSSGRPCRRTWALALCYTSHSNGGNCEQPSNFMVMGMTEGEACRRWRGTNGKEHKQHF